MEEKIKKFMEKGKKDIQRFLEGKEKDVRSITELYPEKKSLVVEYDELEAYDLDIADELLTDPDTVISSFEEILKEMCVSVPGEEYGIHVRFSNLPEQKGYKLPLRKIGAEQIGWLISVEGLVSKIGDVLPKVAVGRFICDRCNLDYDEPQNTRFLRPPKFCKSCKKRNFRFVPDDSKWVDVQKLEIQESLETLRGAEQPSLMEVWLEDDLTRSATIGDRILITCILRLLPPPKKSSVYAKFLEANWIKRSKVRSEDIEITKEEEAEIRKLAKDPKIYEKLRDSIAPRIYGYGEAKDGIVLHLFEGVRRKIRDGSSVRGSIHILLCGDPGLAKSKMLESVNRIAPHSIFTGGKQTSSAGLTTTAEKNPEGGWILKAGVLILASGGYAQIDELGTMEDSEKEGLLQAMESQVVSVAKGGTVATFRADTSILAASNPKYDRFDAYKPLSEQLALKPTLISRFDLIFPIRDIVDSRIDTEIADHIFDVRADEVGVSTPQITPELFRKYIAFAKRNCSPTIQRDSEARKKIREYYVRLRAGSRETVTATPRQLEALARLAEASAKIQLRDVVSLEDAERAIKLMDFVLREIAYDASSGQIDIDIIETAHSHKSREEIRLVEKIIHKRINSSEEGMASLEDIVEKAISEKIDRSRVEQILIELKTKGIIYEPKHGRYMFTEKDERINKRRSQGTENRES